MENDFTIDEIINLMKKTKKTDPMFKPLKKLKIALESIGLDAVSFVSTTRVLIFHFGLGNELDKQIISQTKPESLNQQITIIPGHSYCILNFSNVEESSKYIQRQHQMQQRPVYFQQIAYQNLTRVLVFLFCKDHFLKQAEILQLPNCHSKYIPQTIPGLIVVEDILSKQEQFNLIQNIDEGKWERLNNRRVQHYGYEFKYGRNQIDKDQKQGQLPAYFQPILNKIAQLDILKDYVFDQLTINDYFAGNGIPTHFDTHSPFEQIFLSVSLLSGLVMDFRKYNGEQKFVYLKERSATIFSGEARYAWTHGISSRKRDKIDGQIKHRSRRLSLTFRKIKFSPCQCPYYFYCDSQGYDQEKMKKHNPLLVKYLSQDFSSQFNNYSSSQIQKLYVDKAYNGFGYDFHNKVIEQIKYFMEKDIIEGDIILDIGCGNGQYRKYIPSSAYYIGIQKCTVMIPVENQLYMDCISIGCRQRTFDKVIFVAVLHHFASHQTRLRALKEAWKVLKFQGFLYLTVMNYQSENNKLVYSTPQIFLQYCLPTNKLGKNEIRPKQLQIQIPKIEVRGHVFRRYYHLFTVQQIKQLVAEANLDILSIQLSKENIIIKAIKNDQNNC